MMPSLPSLKKSGPDKSRNNTTVTNQIIIESISHAQNLGHHEFSVFISSYRFYSLFLPLFIEVFTKFYHPLFTVLFFIFLSIIIYNFISFYPIRNYFSPTFAIIFFYYGFICHLLYWVITFFFAS